MHNIPSREGYHYIFFIVDHATKIRWVFPLKSRESKRILSHLTSIVTRCYSLLIFGCSISIQTVGAVWRGNGISIAGRLGEELLTYLKLREHGVVSIERYKMGQIRIIHQTRQNQGGEVGPKKYRKAREGKKVAIRRENYFPYCCTSLDPHTPYIPYYRFFLFLSTLPLSTPNLIHVIPRNRVGNRLWF